MLLGDFFTKEVSPRYQKLGQSLYYISDGIEKTKNGDKVGASESFTLASLKAGQAATGLTAEEKAALERAATYFEAGNYANANIAYDKSTDSIRDSLQFMNEIPDKIADGLQLDMEGNFTWLGDMKKGWDDFWKGIGSGIFNAQYEGYVDMYSNVKVEEKQPSRYDVPLSPTGIPSYVPKDNITVNLNVDGETLATKTIDIQNNETVESNGYYG